MDLRTSKNCLKQAGNSVRPKALQKDSQLRLGVLKREIIYDF